MEILLRWLEKEGIIFTITRKDTPWPNTLPKELHITPNAWVDDLIILVETSLAQKACDMVAEFLNTCGSKRGKYPWVPYFS